MRHVLQKNERRGSPGNCKRFPGRNKEEGSHCEDSTTGTNVHWDKNEQKWSAVLTMSVANKIFAFLFQVSK
jgi:hypothetical protein